MTLYKTVKKSKLSPNCAVPLCPTEPFSIFQLTFWFWFHGPQMCDFASLSLLSSVSFPRLASSKIQPHTSYYKAEMATHIYVFVRRRPLVGIVITTGSNEEVRQSNNVCLGREGGEVDRLNKHRTFIQEMDVFWSHVKLKVDAECF